MIAALANVLLFTLGSSLAGAVTLAVIPTFQPDRPGYGGRVVYFLWRYCLPIMLFQELLLRLFFGRFYP